MDEASGESAGASCAVELDEASCPPIAACDVVHGLVLLHAGFCEVSAQLQHFPHDTRRGVEGGFNISLRQGWRLATVGGESFLFNWMGEFGFSSPVSSCALANVAARCSSSRATAASARVRSKLMPVSLMAWSRA